MNYRWRGSILVLVSAVSFGLMPIFARLAYGSGVGVQALLFIRFVLAFLLMGIFLILTGRVSIPSRNHLLVLLALGGIGYFLQSTLISRAPPYSSFSCRSGSQHVSSFRYGRFLGFRLGEVFCSYRSFPFACISWFGSCGKPHVKRSGRWYFVCARCVYHLYRLYLG